MNSKIHAAGQIIGSMAELARRLNVTKGAVHQWSVGQVPIKHCVSIERLTDGAVNRWDLRPDDWWQIWPELIDHPDAPPIPVSSVVSSPEPSGFGSLPSPSGLGFSSDEVRCG